MKGVHVWINDGQTAILIRTIRRWVPQTPLSAKLTDSE